MEQAQQIYQAHLLVEEGQKKLRPGCWVALCSSKEERLDQAKQCYERAGNQFKLEKKWFQAGECFEKCAQIEEQLKSDPSSFYEEAAHCFKFEDKKRSTQNLNKCVMFFEANGRFSSAGDARNRLAQEYEHDSEYELAITEYRKAADYYEMEKSNSKSNHQSCLIKAADLMCISDHKDAFEESKATYEKIAMQYLSVPLLKSSAKELFFKAVVVFLAYDDYVSGDAYLSKFINEDPSFYDSREHILLKEFIEAMKEKNVTRFRGAVTRFKDTNDIDKWRVNMFTKIMNKIEKESNNFEDIDDFK